eukprot:745933-Hanusia_phi.AAC.1
MLDKPIFKLICLAYCGIRLSLVSLHVSHDFATSLHLSFSFVHRHLLSAFARALLLPAFVRNAALRHGAA